ALALQPVELVDHMAQGERHVVAGVAVGDREDVQIVDLLPARVEVRVSDGDNAAEAFYGRIGHKRLTSIEPLQSGTKAHLPESQTCSKRTRPSSIRASPNDRRGARRRSVGLPGLKI